MTKVAGTLKVVQTAGRASKSVQQTYKIRLLTYTSRSVYGPSAGSYSPPTFGWFKLSSRTGLIICLTEIRLISSEVRKENETDATEEETGRAISISKLSVRSTSKKKGWQTTGSYVNNKRDRNT